MLVACSGGPDSTALAALVRHARPDLRPTLVYVAHGLRAPEIDRAEGEAVVALADRLGVRCALREVDVVRTGGGPESDARDARYAALEAEATQLGAVAVLLGHHADDQAETVLLRLARGTGVDGLAGMARVAGHLFRPLLDVRRVDLHLAAVALLGEAFAAVTTHDPMNDDEAVRRVRIRNNVVPSLESIGPDPVGSLTRMAALARDESAALDHVTARLLVDLPVVTVGQVVAVPSAALRALPDGLARRVLRSVLTAPESLTTAATRSDHAARMPSARTVERMLRAPDGWRATLPGPLEAAVEHGWHVVAPAAAPADATSDVTLELRPSPGRPDHVVHVASGLRISASLHRDGREAGTEGGTDLLAIPSGAVPPGLLPDRFAVRLQLSGPFEVRTRRDGDRVRTPGGTRSLSDVMAEAGVPRALRGLLPVVVGEDDRVGWVPGLVVDEAVRAGTHAGTHADARPDASPAPRPAPRSGATAT